MSEQTLEHAMGRAHTALGEQRATGGARRGERGRHRRRRIPGSRRLVDPLALRGRFAESRSIVLAGRDPADLPCVWAHWLLCEHGLTDGHVRAGGLGAGIGLGSPIATDPIDTDTTRPTPTPAPLDPHA